MGNAQHHRARARRLRSLARSKSNTGASARVANALARPAPRAATVTVVIGTDSRQRTRRKLTNTQERAPLTKLPYFHGFCNGTEAPRQAPAIPPGSPSARRVTSSNCRHCGSMPSKVPLLRPLTQQRGG